MFYLVAAYASPVFHKKRLQWKWICSGYLRAKRRREQNTLRHHKFFSGKEEYYWPFEAFALIASEVRTFITLTLSAT